MRILFFIVFWTWCLLQSFLGLCVYLYVCLFDRKKVGVRLGNGSLLVRSTRLSGGVSLGYFIFSTREYFDKHEQGHQIQSFMLGPLYLIVIGLPSIIWAGFFEGYRKKNNVSYYSFYTEKWADKCSGINRS